MLNKFEIIAEPRTAQGKGASRRLRREGKIPAILYGAGSTPTNIQIEHEKTMLQTENEAFYSHILTLRLGSSEEKVVVKDMQRHPVRKLILHMDFLRIDENAEITLRIPVHFVHEDSCVGVKTGGGVINHFVNDLEVMCLPRDLPEYIEVDLINLNVGQVIHLGDLTLPAGVRIASLVHGGEASLPVVSCTALKAEVAEAAPATAAAAAAPAAAAAKAPAKTPAKAKGK